MITPVRVSPRLLSTFFAKPKLVIFTAEIAEYAEEIPCSAFSAPSAVNDFVNNTFAGFRSRCTIPFSWAACTAYANFCTMHTAFFG